MGVLGLGVKSHPQKVEVKEKCTFQILARAAGEKFQFDRKRAKGSRLKHKV